MDPDRLRAFLADHHQAVLATARGDGRPQMSPVLCTMDGEGRVVISTRETAMKTRNARRRPDVSLCVVSEGFFGEWVQIDGRADIVSLPDAMEGLVEAYRHMAGEHPDWDDFRSAMEREQRVLFRIEVERTGPQRHG